MALNGVSPAAAGVPDGARTIAFDVNRGVPVAWNAAARRARAPVLCIVNDDVVLGRDALALLQGALAGETAAGVVGPVGTRWDIPSARHRSYLELDGHPRGSLHECEVVSGFLLATRRQLFEDLGGFDEAFTPCGFEEVDYCTAVRLRGGLSCCAVAGVEFSHEFAISAARSWRRVRFDHRSESIASIAARNRRHFLEKWSAAAEGTTTGAESERRK